MVVRKKKTKNVKYGALKGGVLFLGVRSSAMSAVGRFSKFGKDGVFSVFPDFKNKIGQGKPVYKTPFKKTSSKGVQEWLISEFGLEIENFKYYS